MNHSRSSTRPFDKAITTFLYFKSAEVLRDRTIQAYQYIFNQCLEHWGLLNLSTLTSQDISEYLSWLRTEYVPKRYGGKTHPLSSKTLRNFWITLSSFLGWASLEYKIKNPMKAVLPPRFQKTLVDTFTQEDVRAMLKAC